MLCQIIVKMVSDALEILSVTIWLVDEKQKTLYLGGSTVFDSQQMARTEFFKDGGTRLIAAMSDQTMPVDLKGRGDDWISDITTPISWKQKKSRCYCVPPNGRGAVLT